MNSKNKGPNFLKDARNLPSENLRHLLLPLVAIALGLQLSGSACSPKPSRSPQGAAVKPATPVPNPGVTEGDPAIDVGGAAPMEEDPTTPSSSGSPAPSSSGSPAPSSSGSPAPSSSGSPAPSSSGSPAPSSSSTPAPSSSSTPAPSSSCSPAPGAGESESSPYRFVRGFCVDAYGNPGRNLLPVSVRDVRDLHEVSAYVAHFGGECLSLRPNRPADPAEIMTGTLAQRSLSGILAAHRGFDQVAWNRIIGLRAVFSHSRWHHALIHDSTFTQAVFMNARLLKVRLELVNLVDSNWKDSRLEKVRFHRSDAHGAQFQGANLAHVAWKDSRLDGAHFEEADLHEQVSFVRTSLQGATFNCLTRLPFPKREARRRGMIETGCPLIPVPLPSVVPVPIPSVIPTPNPTFRPVPVPSLIPVPLPTLNPVPIPTLEPIPPVVPPRPVPTLKPELAPIPSIPR